MEKELIQIIKFAGILFMAVSTALFYNHLITAYFNPGFFVTVYFNFYGEGNLELALFTLFVPFILFTILISFKETLTMIAARKRMEASKRETKMANTFEKEKVVCVKKRKKEN